MIRPEGRLVLHGGVQLLFQKNRGIYSYGTVNTVTSYEKILLTNQRESWYGLVFNQSRNLSLSYVNISGSQHGVVLNVSNVVLTKCDIHNSETYGMTLEINVNFIDMGESVVHNNKEHGMFIKSESVVIKNGVIFNNSDSGLYFDDKTETATVQAMNIYGNRRYGIYFRHSADVASLINITKCYIHDHSNKPGVYITSDRYVDAERNTSISSCSFENNVKGSIQTSRLDVAGSNKIFLDLSANKFSGFGHVELRSSSPSNITLRENSFNSTSSKCLVAVNFENSRSVELLLNILSNTIRDTTGTCGFSLQSSTQTEGGFLYNEISQSVFTEGSLLLGLSNYTVSQNILDNPESDFEIKVIKVGSASINASKNWWGTTNLQLIGERILDKEDDTTLLDVIFQPILEGRDFDCSLVKNCSGHGECVRPNGCECIIGWKGSSCDMYDCSEFSDCNGGMCIGPNQCLCNAGWIGDSCTIATCYGVNNCSERGFCVGPDTCNCLSQYAGRSCEACAQNRWGEHCIPCQRCVHGSCAQDTGECICESVNWNGTLCDRCSPSFYGPDCLPLATVLNISPIIGPDIGGTMINVKGDNFNISDTNSHKCKFGSVIVDAIRLSSHHFTCVTPKLSPRTVPVEISSDGKEFTNNKVEFTFVARCLVATCGSKEDPPHGQCLFGQCTCSLPWIGDTCSVEIIPPIVDTVLDTQIFEGQVYYDRMTLIQGTNVIRWSLLESPDGMVINGETGELSWEKTVGTKTPYVVSVRAENAAGQHDIVWFLIVPLSYTVIIDETTPSGVLPYPSEIYITGHLNMTETSINTTSRIAKIIIQNNGRTRELDAKADLNDPPAFAVNFIPRPDDVGEFSLSANHPSDDEFLEQASWTIQSLEVEPRFISLTEYIDTGIVKFPHVANLTIPGADPVEDIDVEISAYPYNLNLATVDFVSQSSSNESLIQTVPAKGSETFDLTVVHDMPVRTALYIVFRSQLGTRTSLRVQLNLKVRHPVLQLSPSPIRKTIVRGKQTIFNVNITNSGDAVAEDVKVQIPDGLDLQIVSISSPFMLSSGQLDVAEGETATVVFVYTVPSDKPLGVVSGSIEIKSMEISTLLNFDLYVTSDQRFDIQVFVEDEYTYFAADKPLLSGAKITLKNPRRGIALEHLSDETGSATFMGVYGDQYTLEVEADNHTSTSVVLVVDGTKSKFTVFLQRTAVTYTWSVTKTTFEDRYRINLESTFETRVPMPVVTVEPAKVDLFPYEEGRSSRLEFLVTNHGYIRANNVRFTLPSHPKLEFIQLVDRIGNLDANSSIVVPFQVERKTIVKRSTGRPCGMAVLYDYECGSTRTQGVSIVLISEPPGESPRSCGGGRWRGRLTASPGGGRAGFRVFATTVIPCDCAKAIMNDCIKPLLRLPFELVPGLGCLLDLYDISKIDKSTSPVSVATTTASYLLDCGFGLTCPVCIPLFKYLNCLDGLNRGCKKDGRRKREVSSELVLEVRKSREFLLNYLNLTKELAGNLSVVDVKGEWKTAFFQATDENSPLEYLISGSEAENVLKMVTAEDRPLIEGYLDRWNNTFRAWRDGVSLPADTNAMSLPNFRSLTDIFVENTNYVKERGFSTIFRHFEYTINEYRKSIKEDKTEEGICAKVRIRISQDLVLTRDAFLARLEIENGENAPLEEIKVEIFITKSIGNGSSDTHLFSIGNPKLGEISDVSGTGTLDAGIDGSAEWLIVAYNGAAVGEDVDYDVGGTLSYIVEGREFNVPLLPDTITVSPNPSLALDYFHEKYVQGNDPFTETTEKSVPFSLSVMVTNKGDGVARQIRLTSGQPEIIENEKGLLIAFKIISAQLGSNPIQPSLTVDFGDISSHETKTARWLMTSTLKGRFYNYSATFENINPLGDPELSVFESISYHDMIHLVRIDDSDDDGLDDFLVNDVIDKDNLPDRLYDSSNGFDTYPVEVVSPVTFTKMNEDSKGTKDYMLVRIEVPQSRNWRYSRIVNNITRDVESESLLQVTRDDGKDILIPQNSWLTSYYDNEFYFHLFDYGTNETEQSVYTAVFGRANLYSPSFANESYYAETEGTASSKNILKVQATDKDDDDVTYKVAHNGTLLTVDAHSGMISNALPLIENGTFVIKVYAIDDGVPSRTSSVSVTVVVTTSVTTDDDTTITTEETVSDTTTQKVLTTSTSESRRIEYIPLMCYISVLLLLILSE